MTDKRSVPNYKVGELVFVITEQMQRKKSFVYFSVIGTRGQEGFITTSEKVMKDCVIIISLEKKQGKRIRE